jgi:SAM-dependent MidA family methyltransferase
VSLRQTIAREIAERGPIPFSRYMELCLYHPELGYYARDANQFGKAGDFYTSSDVHAVFGRLLARQFEEMWRVLGSPAHVQLLELGPGRGLFAQDVLDWSEKKFPAFFGALRYHLLEASPALREKIRHALERHIAADRARLADWQNLPASGATVVFANEFFDALPVEVVSSEGQLHVGIEGERFVELWQPSSAEVTEFLDRHSVQPEHGERVEAPVLAQQYMTRVCETVERGFVIAVDYGYTRAEQLAGRHRGTIAAFRRHSLSTNPYEAPGEQDLTAHANFTALTAAAENSGMHAQPLITQSQFLLGVGEATQFADVFEDCRLPQERAKVALQLKHLVTPAGMGESFHVLIASRGVDEHAVRKLSGLSFGTHRGA